VYIIRNITLQKYQGNWASETYVNVPSDAGLIPSKH